MMELHRTKSFQRERRFERKPGGEIVISDTCSGVERTTVEIRLRDFRIIRDAIHATRDRALVGRRKIGVVAGGYCAVFVDHAVGENVLTLGTIVDGKPRAMRLTAAEVDVLENQITASRDASSERKST